MYDTGEIISADHSPGARLARLDRLPLNGYGEIVAEGGVVIGRLVVGDVAALTGYWPDHQGEILDQDGDLIGRVEAV